MTDMNNKARKISADFRAMGTDVSAEIIFKGDAVEEEKDRAQKDIESVKEIFSANEKIFSRFREDSELAKMNASLGKEIVVSEKMLAVLELCVKFYGLSFGYFDPRIIDNLEKIGYDKDFRSNDLNDEKEKSIELEKIDAGLQDDLILDAEKKTAVIRRRIDTTGIAKGFTVDEAAHFLESMGWKNFVVDAGGDMFAQGLDEENHEWEIGVEGLDDSKIRLRLKDEGIATSGISRKRWNLGGKKVHHLINPKDPGNFSCDVKTVTVIEEKTVEADGRAKVLVLMGKEKGLQFANEKNMKALFLDYRGNVYISERLKENIIK